MAYKCKEASIDRLAVEQLSRLLQAESSRVFKCATLHRNVLADGGKPEQFLFNTPNLNNAIFMKEIYPDKEMRESSTKPVGTKIFFSFNEKAARDGGKSIFLNDSNLRSALQFHAGMSEAPESEEANADLRVLKILDALPSIDPFLFRERMEAEGIDAHPGYFEINPAEFGRVRDHLMKKFQPIVEIAFKNMGYKISYLNTLVNKLWEAKDMDALGPLLKALRVQESDAPGILYAWKGIIYYEHIFARRQDLWKDYAHWLNAESRPIDNIPAMSQATLNDGINQWRKLHQRHRKAVNLMLAEYRNSYTLLFRDHESPEPFIHFLSKAGKRFYQIGDSISRIDHAIELWKTYLANSTMRFLRYEQLQSLSRVSTRILRGS